MASVFSKHAFLKRQLGKHDIPKSVFERPQLQAEKKCVYDYRHKVVGRSWAPANL